MEIAYNFANVPNKPRTPHELCFLLNFANRWAIDPSQNRELFEVVERLLEHFQLLELFQLGRVLVTCSSELLDILEDLQRGGLMCTGTVS